MRVEDIMTRDVRTCRPHQTAADAARIMWERDCGCVPVVDDEGELAGILTDRDLCIAAFTRGVPLHEIRIDSVMQRNVQTCRRTDSVAEAERRMSEAQVRRIPIVGGLSEIVGILSLSDVARARDRSWRARIGERLLGDVTKTLARIVQPRTGAETPGAPGGTAQA